MKVAQLRKIQKLVRLMGRIWIRLEVTVGDLIEEMDNGSSADRN